MAEVVGPDTGATALAALFSNCIDCFACFRAASNCPAEAETLLVKLDCEKARLLIWANNIGIMSAVEQGRHVVFADEECAQLVVRCVEQIAGLLTIAQQLKSMYGARQMASQENQHYLAVVSANGMNVFRTARNRFFARFGVSGKSSDWFVGVKWAIRDAAKFRLLLARLRELVDNLISLVPIPSQQIDHTVEEDITTIVDIGNLKLIENACKECYPDWSARASETIRQSETGTVDRRNLEEMLHDAENPHFMVGQSIRPQRDLFKKGNTLLRWLTTFTVFTHRCLSSGANNRCEAEKISDAITGQQNLSFTCPASGRWSLAERLRPYVHETSSVSGMRNIPKFEHQQLERLYFNTIYVYCGACACAIQSALSLREDRSLNPDYQPPRWSIRIDDRLPTSCHRKCSAIDVLQEIRDTIESRSEVVRDKGSKPPPIESIDLPHLEGRIRCLEDFDSTIATRTLFQEILDEQHASLLELPARHGPLSVIFLIEADTCHSSFDEFPFRREARRPRKGEIFLIKPDLDSESHGLVDRVHIGSYSRSQEVVHRDSVERRLSSRLEASLTSGDDSNKA